MKRKLMLVGALAILSTTALGTPGVYDRVTALEGETGRIDEELSNIRKTIIDERGEMWDYVDEKVSINRQSINHSFRNINENRDNIADLKERVDTNKETRDAHQTWLNDLEKEVNGDNGLKAKVEINSDKIEKIDSKLNTLDTSMKANNTAIRADIDKVSEDLKKADVVINSKINNLENNSATKEEVKKVSDRVSGVHNVQMQTIVGDINKAEAIHNSISKLDPASGEYEHVYGDTTEAIKKSSESQANAFDKVVDAVVDNRDKIKDLDEDRITHGKMINSNETNINSLEGRVTANEGKIWNAQVQSSNSHANIANSMIEAGKKLGIEEDYEDKNGEPIFNAEQASQASGRVFDKTVDAIVKNKEDIKNKVDKQELDKVDADLQAHKAKTDEMDKIQNEQIDKLEATDKKIDGQISKLEATDKKVDDQIEKLKETDKNLAQTDAQLQEVDKELKEKDAKIEANIAKLHNHDSAIYEEGVTYRNGAPVVKADVNREMIKNLANGTTKAVEDVEAKVDTNTKHIKENKETLERHDGLINQNYELTQHNAGYIEQNSQRIGKLETRVQSLENEMNRGFAMAAATASIVYPELGKGDLGIGAGMGGYSNAQAAAVGIAMQPTENFRVNANVSTSDGADTMYGAGFGYRFNLFN